MELIGRDRELAELVDRLRRRRLVTVVGPGGIGKTALAHRVLHDLAPEEPAGASVVDLTSVDEPDGVPASIAGQLGLPDFDSLLGGSDDRATLVLVDNCEHVLDAAAAATRQMLQASSRRRVLATSRAPLDLPGEAVFPIQPLPVPRPRLDEDTAALDLLRVRAADHGVTVTDADPEVVAEICRRLDGMPLAIELAAARLRTRSVSELLTELDARPHALARPRFRGNPTHRSVSEMVGWSTALLEPGHRRFFERLAVFAGAFTVELAAAVAVDDHEVADGTDRVDRSAGMLDELVAVSLVAADTRGEVTRYRLLHPVRAVALHRLTEAGELQERRSRWVDHVVEAAVGIIIGAGSRWDAAMLDELFAMYDNITSALRWLLAEAGEDGDEDGGEDDARRALLLTAVLWGFVHEGHTHDVSRLAEQVLARWPDRGAPHWAEAAATAATARGMLGDDDGAIALATEALDHVGSSPFAPSILERARARAARSLGRYAEARDRFRAGAEAADANGNITFALEQWADHAVMVARTGDVDGALAVIDRVEAEAAAHRTSVNEIWARACRGIILWQERPGEAEAIFVQVESWSRRIGYAAGVWAALRGLAFVAAARGDRSRAASSVLSLLDDIGRRGGTGELRSALDIAAVLAEEGALDGWADLAVTAEAMAVSMVSISVEPDLFRRAAATGRVLGPRQALETARAAMEAVVANAGSTSASASGPVRSGSDPMGPGPVAAPSAEAAAPGPGPQAQAGVQAHAEARRRGDLWELTYEGRTTALRASKGLDDLAVLLSRPGVEVAAVDLVGAAVVGGGAVHEVIDAEARRRYEDRIRELQSELDAAEADHDRGRSERLTDELDAVVDHLAAAVGRGGRTRSVPREVERARSAVTQRLRSALRRIAEHDADLGAHLQASVETGTYCRYRPPTPTRWLVIDGRSGPSSGDLGAP